MTRPMRVTLALPPLTQLNTPYPSISYLAQFLGERGVACIQRDLGLELALRLLSREGLRDVFDELEQLDELPEPAWRALSLRDHHVRVIDAVIGFLQGRDTSLASTILGTPLLPAGPRLAGADLDAFGPMGTADAARYLATLYLEDLADLVTSCIDPGFGLARYHAHLATSAHSFDPIWDRLQQTTLIDRYLDELGDTLHTEVVALSVPFPGNLYGALRLGRRLKQRGVVVVMGGGYVSTELRSASEPRLWQLVDALTYDDGETPLLAILEHHAGQGDRRHRTRTAEGVHDAPTERPAMTCAPDYGELPLHRYLQLIDTLNPAHRLWADGRWNKITIAHGCYWRRCTFCDVNLDYVAHYESASTVALVDHMERLVRDTGQRGFHFVDEAAPPSALKALALELLRRDLSVTLWGNIRFETAFTPDLCKLLAAAGVIAVTGGLEVANDRLLALIDKGVTVQQAARAAAAFRAAGIMVHAYLMYGFPTQTEQETLDSMEVVRQLFAAGLINSAFWHRFVLTRHAPIARAPGSFHITIEPSPAGAFASNDLAHRDPTGTDHHRFDEVLPRALASWLQGRELERPVHQWFADPVPHASVPRNLIGASLTEAMPRAKGRLVWLGGEPLRSADGVTLHHADGELLVPGTEDELDWLVEVLQHARPSEPALSFRDARDAFPGDWKTFASRWFSLAVALVQV